MKTPERQAKMRGHSWGHSKNEVAHVAHGEAHTLESFLADLNRRGVAVWTVNGQVAVRPAHRLTTVDQAMIREHREALVALLSSTTTAPWNLTTALRLMDAADAAVNRSGVSGSHPEIQAGVAMVSTAYAAKDLSRVRAGCDAMKAVVLRLSARSAPTRPGRSV